MDKALTDWKQLHGDAFRNSRVLVTGGAGFIGSHLCDALSSLGAMVVVLDDFSGGSDENLRGIPRIQVIRGSVLDQKRVEQAMQACRWVFHQAALGSVPQSIRQPRLYYEVNVTGTLNVLESARMHRVHRVVYAASSSAYGDSPELPKYEQMPPSPRSPYAASKLAGEGLMKAYTASYGIDTCSLRYFNIFGPRQNANSAYAAVIAAFAKALLAGQPPTIYGDGEQSRDFTFVHNAVHANLLAARSSTPLEGEVFNVGTGARITVLDLARQMSAQFGLSDLKPRHEPPRAGDVKHSLADLTHISKSLGYRPVVGFAAGLEQTLAWYRSSATATTSAVAQK